MSFSRGIHCLFRIGRGFSLALPFLVGGSGIVAGCTDAARTYCEIKEQCRGGNDKDIEACIALRELAAERADIIGCTSERDEFDECVIEVLTCESYVTSTMCTLDTECTSQGYEHCGTGACVARRLSSPGCSAESKALQACQCGSMPCAQ